MEEEDKIGLKKMVAKGFQEEQDEELSHRERP